MNTSVRPRREHRRPTPVTPVKKVSAGTRAQDALPGLIEIHGPRLYSLATRLCGNAADAQDMVQDVFLQAFRKWHTFAGRSDPGTWLYAIAARSCKARLRRKGGVDRRLPALSQLMPFKDSETVRFPDPADSKSPGPLAASIHRESARAVQDAILELPENFRVPLVLKEMLELPLEEVAKALNIKVETAKTRVHRARLMLRQAIMSGSRVPKAAAPKPTYEKQVCLDLLKAKLDAMDKGRGFPIGQKVVCARCRSVFAELDLAQDACLSLAEGELPAKVRSAILSAIRAEGAA